MSDNPSVSDGDSRGSYAGFQGKVGLTRAVSEPWWEPQPQPSEDAPNVLVILMDDLGFSDFGCFGAEWDTPEIDRLAAEGLRFTNFHVTPLCSPSRAALLTGLNHHMVGIGQVIEGTGDTGFPGYRGELAADALTAAEVFKSNGYTTIAVGKWHVTNELTEGGPKTNWPLQRGFDRYYGFMSQTDFWNPGIVDDNHMLDIEEFPEGYYLTDDLTDHAIEMIRQAKSANPDRPFMMYFAHAAMHAPLHAKPVDIAKYRDAYDEGWDVIRQRRFERQLDLGLIPPGTTLPPRNAEPSHSVKPWDELSDEQRELFARYMTLYAAMVDNVDQNLSRLRLALEELGEWDNTLLMLMSDNGASRTGGENGTSNFYRTVTNTLPGAGSFADDFELDYSLLGEMGGPRTFPGNPHGWAMVSNTPFRLYKMNTHAGGHRVPLILSWPRGIAEGQGACRSQYVHAIDVLPTLIDLAGVSAPSHRHGRPVKPFQGRTVAEVIHDPTAESPRTEQYYEMWGHRGYYDDGDEIVTLHQRTTPFSLDRWEMYDLRSDPTETSDLAADNRARVDELIESWNQAAWANQVYPLDERIGLNQIRPPDEREFKRVLLLPSMPRFFGAGSLMSRRSFRVDIDVAWAPGDAGVLIAYGGQHCGFVLFVEDSALQLEYNFYGRVLGFRGGAMEAGAHIIQLHADAHTGGVWDLRVLVDGVERGIGRDFPMLSGQGGASGLDVGVNRKSPVSWGLYQRYGTFRYRGALQRVVLVPGEPPQDRGPDYFRQLREEALRLQ
jgi:arylsulfatase